MRVGDVKGRLLDMVRLLHCAAMTLCSKSSQQDQSHSSGLHQLNSVGYKKNRGQAAGCAGSLAPDRFDDLGQMCEVELIRDCDHLLFKLVALGSLGWFCLYSLNGCYEWFYNQFCFLKLLIMLQ